MNLRSFVQLIFGIYTVQNGSVSYKVNFKFCKIDSLARSLFSFPKREFLCLIAPHSDKLCSLSSVPEEYTLELGAGVFSCCHHLHP